MSDPTRDQDQTDLQSRCENDQSSGVKSHPNEHDYDKSSSKSPEKVMVTKARSEHRFLGILQSPSIKVQVGSGCNTTSFQVPKHILLQSPTLAKKLNTEDRISFSNEDPNTVASFVEYLYTREYFPRRLANPSDELEKDSSLPHVDTTGEQLIKHAKIYFLAQKLQLPVLESLATSKIHRIHSTAEAEVNYARYVYQDSNPKDSVIRGPVVMTWAHRAHVLRHEADAGFKALCLDFPQFGHDVLNVILDAREEKKRKHKATVEPSNEEPAGRAKRRKVQS